MPQITTARRSVGKQFILITPNAIEGRAKIDKDVKIIRQVLILQLSPWHVLDTRTNSIPGSRIHDNGFSLTINITRSIITAIGVSCRVSTASIRRLRAFGGRVSGNHGVRAFLR